MGLGRLFAGPSTFNNTSIQAPEVRTTSTILDASGNAIASTDGNGVPTLFGLDRNYRPILTMNALGGFLRGWNAGNRFAHSALMALGSRSESSKPVYDLPRGTIRAYWEWNFYRDEIGEDLALDDYDVFVPRVFFVEQDGQVKSIAMWPEAIPTALPVVDLVLLSRYELLDIEEEDEEPSDAVAIVTWDELRGVTKDFEMVKDPDDPMPDYLILSYEELPEAIHQWLCDRPGLTERVTQISIGDVLDRELIEEVQKEGSQDD